MYLQCVCVHTRAGSVLVLWTALLLIQSEQLCQERMQVQDQDRTEVAGYLTEAHQWWRSQGGCADSVLRLGSSPHPQAKLCPGVLLPRAYVQSAEG